MVKQMIFVGIIVLGAVMVAYGLVRLIKPTRIQYQDHAFYYTDHPFDWGGTGRTVRPNQWARKRP